MSEFGFQSFPEMRTILSFAQPTDPTIDSTVMMSHQKNHGGSERILTYMLREYPEPRDFASFVYVSQVQQAEAIKVGAEHLRRNRPRTMGALFWQLNDCWPVASWSSVDYFGRWKALQYYARRFYADVLVSPYAHDGVVDVYIVSDKVQAANGQLRMRLLDFEGKTLSAKTQDVQIPSQSSAVYLSVNEKELLGSASPDRAFLIVDLQVGGQTVSRNEVFFHRTRNLELPLKPAIQSSISGNGPEYTITLHSPVLARDVYLSFGDVDARLSDNYFDLLPGEEMIVRVKSSANVDQLKQAMKIVSLSDAFFEERPTYRGHLSLRPAESAASAH
jgi:beta-mannosidase